MRTNIEQTELTAVSNGLQDIECITAEAIIEKLISWILIISTGFTEQNMEYYDVRQQNTSRRRRWPRTTALRLIIDQFR